MPNRIIREAILRSERVDAIADRPEVEVFYRRLHSVVDDFGRYPAHPSLLRAAAFPLRLDSVSNSQVADYLAACELAGLVVTYEVGAKRFLQVLDFNQRTRASESRFPPPPEGLARGGGQSRAVPMLAVGRSNDGQATVIRQTDGGESRTSGSHPRTYTETETYAGTETLSQAETGGSARGASEFLEAYPKKTGIDAAARAYVSLIQTDHEHLLLMNGLRRWMGSGQWRRSLEADGGRFVPDADKFLFDRKYLDDPPACRGATGRVSAIDEVMRKIAG